MTELLKALKKECLRTFYNKTAWWRAKDSQVLNGVYRGKYRHFKGRYHVQCLRRERAKHGEIITCWLMAWFPADPL